MHINKQTKKIESLGISFALIAIAGLSFAASGLFTLIFATKENFVFMNLFFMSIFMLTFFIILPLFVANKIYGININRLKYNYKLALIYFIIGLFIFRILLKLSYDQILHNLVVAICEEFLFRFIIFEILKENFSKKEAVIIGSVLFALVLHLNSNILINIATKLPASILFYILYEKLGLEHAIFFHRLNNSLVAYL